MANTQFPRNPSRFDPLKNFRFRVTWDDSPIPGIFSVSPLTRTTQVVATRDGAENFVTRLNPGQTTYGPIVLQRYKTHDPKFEQWANKVWDLRHSFDNADLVSLRDFRKDIVIEVENETGQLVFRYLVFRCWVSDYQAVPQLDSLGNGALVEILTLQNEGWERDTSVEEQVEPSFTEPAE